MSADLIRLRKEIEDAVREAIEDLEVTDVVSTQAGDRTSLDEMIGHVTGFALAAVKPYMAGESQ